MNLSAVAFEPAVALEFFEAVYANDMEWALQKVNLQICVGFKIAVTIGAELVVLRITNLVSSQLLLCPEAVIAGCALVVFGLQLSK